MSKLVKYITFVLIITCFILVVLCLIQTKSISSAPPPPERRPRTEQEQQHVLFLLQKLKTQCDQFVKQLHDQYPNDERLHRLVSRYNRTTVEESKTAETYTLNKGDKIVMCMHDYTQANSVHDDFNLLMFVMLHELGHIMSESVDHTDEYWDNFKFILKHAARWGYYHPVDYKYNPRQYCNMVLYTNPYFEEKNARDVTQSLCSIVGCQSSSAHER